MTFFLTFYLIVWLIFLISAEVVREYRAHKKTVATEWYNQGSVQDPKQCTCTPVPVPVPVPLPVPVYGL